MRSPRVELKVRRRVFIAEWEQLYLGSPMRRSIRSAALVSSVVVPLTNGTKIPPWGELKAGFRALRKPFRQPK